MKFHFLYSIRISDDYLKDTLTWHDKVQEIVLWSKAGERFNERIRGKQFTDRFIGIVSIFSKQLSIRSMYLNL